VQVKKIDNFYWYFAVIYFIFEFSVTYFRNAMNLSAIDNIASNNLDQGETEIQVYSAVEKDLHLPKIFPFGSTFALYPRRRERKYKKLIEVCTHLKHIFNFCQFHIFKRVYIPKDYSLKYFYFPSLLTLNPENSDFLTICERILFL